MLGVGLFLIAAAYTWAVHSWAPEELWSWGHELAATLVSVGFAVVVGLALYRYQVKTTNAGRKRELRALLITNVMDIWDALDEKKTNRVRLPDGSTEEVLLTFLQPLVFEEAVRSGIFSTNEVLRLIRVSGNLHIYNAKASRYLEIAQAYPMGDYNADMLRHVIRDVRESREAVIQATLDLTNHWPEEEVQEALASSKR